MSALDDAYRAAADALRNRARGESDWQALSSGEAATIAIEAFLAHLADNPPEEMVEAAAIADYNWCSGKDTEPWERTDEYEREQCRDHARVCLSAALRAVGGDHA